MSRRQKKRVGLGLLVIAGLWLTSVVREYRWLKRQGDDPGNGINRNLFIGDRASPPQPVSSAGKH